MRRLLAASTRPFALCPLIAVLAALPVLAPIALAPAARADEGMWTYDRAPVALIQERHGFAPSQEWLDHLRLSSLDVNASASFVSPDGLILTNHHVAMSAIQRISTAERNLLRDGFRARSRESELPLPAFTARVLVSTEDVTARVEAAVKPNATPAQALAQREAAKAAIAAEGEKVTGLACEIVTLYGGAQHWLYRAKLYTDVRLVCAPELQAAFFGGDWDNFCYPRHDLDFAFLRAYENGQPAKVEHYLKIDPDGIDDGVLVFVSGHPGRTARLHTMAGLEWERDVSYPAKLERSRRTREVLRQYSARSAEAARRARQMIYGLGNSLKAMEGEHAGLRDPELMAVKLADEKALRAAVAADPALEAKYGGAWERAAAAYAWARAHEKERLWKAEMPGSRFTNMALTLVRYGQEIRKKDGERMPGYHDAQLADLLRPIQSQAPYYKDMEEVLLADALTRLQTELGAGDPLVAAALQGQAPAAAAAAAIAGTRLDDLEFRKQLLAEKGSKIAKTADPLLDLARRLEPPLRATYQEFRDNVWAVEEQAEADIARARFAIHGEKSYPDATGTLRLGFGKVAGYAAATTLVPPFTTLHGLYDRALGFGDQGDFALAPKVREGRPRAILSTPLNFVCTADITGGNSGSPIVDRQGRLVGVAFDGNQTSHPNKFVYRETDARCVVVDIRGIIEALRVFYDAGPVADELIAAAK